MSDPNIPDNVNTVPAEGGTTWVEIASTGSEDEAKLIQGFLENSGIAAQVENVKFSMEPINFGTMGDIRVYVSAEDETRAQELMRQREVAYDRLDDDTETLVTDEGEATVDENSRAESDDGANS
ncbi:MAG TPA: DUF2007 domain-containing protein [Thermoanaerobaculia bacterium]|jgi:hypothetical protein